MAINPIITRAPYFEPPQYDDVDGMVRKFSRHGRMMQNRHAAAVTKIKVEDLKDDQQTTEGEKNDSIYYILKPALFLSKHMGIFPLSGAYEFTRINRYWRRILFDRVIPIVSFCWLCFTGSVIMQVLASNDTLLTRRGVDYYSVLITNLLNIALSIMPAGAAYFRNERLVNFVGMFSRVDDLLTEKKSSARRRVFFVYIGLLSLQTCKSYYWVHLISKVGSPDTISFDPEKWGILTPLLTPLFYAGLFFHSVGESHTQAAYFAIVFSMGVGFAAIKSSMVKLEEEHLKSGTESFSDDGEAGAVVVQRLRELRLQHVFLVQMGRRLDHLFSPVLFITFIIESMTTSVILFQLINTKNYATWVYPIGVLFYGLGPFSAMMIVCTFADRTIKASNAIAAVIFSSELTANPACRAEINLYALQLNVHQAQFNASGFFPINHSLAGTIIGIAITYSIVMIQLRGVEKEGEIDE